MNGIVKNNPSHIWIEPTNRCNIKCRHCRHYDEDFGEDMEESLFREIQKTLLPDIKHATLIGYGEPLLAKNFGIMMEECFSRNISIDFITNGTLIDENKAKYLSTKDVTITISIEGAKKETHEFIRPFVKWETMMEKLAIFKRASDAAGENKRWHLRFNFVAMRRSVDDLPELVNLADRYGIEAIAFLPITNEKYNKYLYDQSIFNEPEIIIAPLSKALSLAKEKNIGLEIPISFREIIEKHSPPKISFMTLKFKYFFDKLKRAYYFLRRRGVKQFIHKIFGIERINKMFGIERINKTFCTAPWNSVFIKSNGDVYPCCVCGYKIGNFEEQWDEIWNNDLYRNLRRTIHSYNPTFLCRKCIWGFGTGLGITGGDENHYEHYFSKFKENKIYFGEPFVFFKDGFFVIEYNGGEPDHCWMGQKGNLTIPYDMYAKFIHFKIIPNTPNMNFGRLRINGKNWEPFDNTCQDIHFPIPKSRSRVLNIEIEMEYAFVPTPVKSVLCCNNADGDPRDLGLGISGISLLSK